MLYEPAPTHFGFGTEGSGKRAAGHHRFGTQPESRGARGAERL
jgi:hypothetical protein